LPVVVVVVASLAMVVLVVVLVVIAHLLLEKHLGQTQPQNLLLHFHEVQVML
jgi:hypothetical protein